MHKIPMNLSYNNGFLLIELVIVVAIIAFFISSTMLFRVHALRQQTLAINSMNLLDELNLQADNYMFGSGKLFSGSKKIFLQQIRMKVAQGVTSNAPRAFNDHYVKQLSIMLIKGSGKKGSFMRELCMPALIKDGNT